MKLTEKSLEQLMVELSLETGKLAVLVRDSYVHIAPKSFNKQANKIARVAKMVAKQAEQILIDEQGD